MKRPTTPATTMAMLFLLLSFLSCNNEELFLEPENEVIEDVIDETDEPQYEDNTANTVDTSLPCEFTLNTIDANSTVIINCELDLEGNTLTLPANINIQFEGGAINNGTLVFSGGTIDGDLLNISLGIDGDVNLKTNSFTFYPEKWNIVEGKTTKEISLNNRENINKAIELVDQLGADIFEIGKLDAYFNVEANKLNREYHRDRSIRIPSDFHLKMSDDTFLRVQPTHFPSYSLITTYVKDNVIISGGNLFGDRWGHDYSPITDIVGVARDTHGYGFLIYVIGTHNITIENVTIKDAIGDGIIVHSKTIRQPDGTLSSTNRTSEDVVIKKCTFDENRRNGIAVIDANGVLIDNCDLLNTGSGEQAYDGSGNEISSTSGTAPRYGIDLEALRYINDDGTMNEINKIENVVIRNSRFKGNAAGDVVVYTVNNVIIENNYFDKWVANFAANDIVIRNNIFKARSSDISFAINVQSFIRNDIEFNYNYSVYGNKITGYEDGIKLAGKNHNIYDNEINDCKIGIQLGSDFKDTTISGNIIKSSLPNSFGYKNFPGAKNMSGIKISNEFIDVVNRPTSLIRMNNESTSTNTEVSFDGCTFNTKNNNFYIHVDTSKNIEFKNNTSNTDFEIIDSDNIILTNNSVSN
jgi:hypothetical protein